MTFDHGTASDRRTLATAIDATKGFVYVNGAEVALISVCWFLCSLPLVTVGPATVGAYSAINSLRQHDGLRWRAVLRSVRAQFVGSTLLGLFPVFLFGASLLYLGEYLRTGSALAAGLGLAGVYATGFTLLVYVPAFALLARGNSPPTAVRTGFLWVSHHPTLALATGLLTAVLFLVTSLLMVAFVVLFAGTAAALHLEIVSRQLGFDGPAVGDTT